MTYAQIADELGISCARVQQIEANALRKLRRACLVIGLRLEDLAPGPWRPPADIYSSRPSVDLVSLNAIEFTYLPSALLQTSAERRRASPPLNSNSEGASQC